MNGLHVRIEGGRWLTSADTPVIWEGTFVGVRIDGADGGGFGEGVLLPRIIVVRHGYG